MDGWMDQSVGESVYDTRATADGQVLGKIDQFIVSFPSFLFIHCRPYLHQKGKNPTNSEALWHQRTLPYKNVG